MTSTNLTTRLEQQLDAARAALRTLPKFGSDDDDDAAIAAACDLELMPRSIRIEQRCRWPRSAI